MAMEVPSNTSTGSVGGGKAFVNFDADAQNKLLAFLIRDGGKGTRVAVSKDWISENVMEEVSSERVKTVLKNIGRTMKAVSFVNYLLTEKITAEEIASCRHFRGLSNTAQALGNINNFPPCVGKRKHPHTFTLPLANQPGINAYTVFMQKSCQDFPDKLLFQRQDEFRELKGKEPERYAHLQATAKMARANTMKKRKVARDLSDVSNMCFL